MQGDDYRPYIADKLALLPSDYQRFVKSEYVRDVVQKIADGYELNADQIFLLENNIALLLLLIVPQSEFTESLAVDLAIAKEDAEGLSEILFERFPEEVLGFLDQYQIEYDNEIQPPTEVKKQQLAKLAETFSKPREPQLENGELATPQEQTENVTPLRTMEGDMTRIHGYGAYNAELAGENSTPEDQDEEK